MSQVFRGGGGGGGVDGVLNGTYPPSYSSSEKTNLGKSLSNKGSREKDLTQNTDQLISHPNKISPFAV